jgi:CTP:molybdopterin cytidylyltransferase MocA
MTVIWPDSGAPRLVILAAGASSRLGSPKALAPLPGGTPVDRILKAWPLNGSTPTVVTGAHHKEISEHLAGTRNAVHLLHNTLWDLGRTGSLQAAIQQHAYTDLMVAPVDCPRIPKPVFEVLLDAWYTAGCPAMGWLAPYVVTHPGGKKGHGHPILIGRGLLRRVLGFGPDDPLRGLRASATPIFDAQVSHPEILEDLDTPQDLERLQREDCQST